MACAFLKLFNLVSFPSGFTFFLHNGVFLDAFGQSSNTRRLSIGHIGARLGVTLNQAETDERAALGKHLSIAPILLSDRASNRSNIFD
jgi:hypothetical protein